MSVPAKRPKRPHCRNATRAILRNAQALVALMEDGIALADPKEDAKLRSLLHELIICCLKEPR